MTSIISTSRNGDFKVISKRIPMLDYARLLTAFLVIYGHLFPYEPNNYVRVFIYQFHMPLFFVISGMLHKYNGSVQWYKYVRTILVPVVFFAFLFFIVTGLLYSYSYGNYKESVLNEIFGGSLWKTYISYFIFSIKGMGKGTVMLDGPCWFLIALFYCKIFMDVCILKKRIGILALAVLFFVLCMHVHRYLFMANSVMAMPFYGLGYVYKDKLLAVAKIKHPLVLSLFTFCIALLIMLINGSVSMWSVLFGAFGNFSIPLFYMHGFVGTLMILSLCSIMNKSYPIITKCANSLISILGLQALFIFLSDNFLKVEWTYLEAILISSVIMLLCIGCNEIIIRYCPILIGKIKK